MRWLVVVLCLLICGGCARYKIGPQSLYRCDVKTVYVPIFESDSYRRQLGERLTEAVIKEIQNRTHFILVGPAEAETVLRGRITNESKRVIANSPTDEPRVNELQFRVELTWVDRTSGKTHELGDVPFPTGIATAERNALVVPEAGQSIATGQQEVINKLAQQIVSQMEKPW